MSRNCDKLFWRSAAHPFPYILLSRAAVLPVSLAEVKSHLNIDSTFTADDALLTALISVAIDAFDHYTHQTLISSSFLTKRDCFERCTILKRAPLVTITNLTYIDLDGVSQTVAVDEYKAVDDYPFGRMYLTDEFTNKEVAGYPSQISITFSAGMFDDADDVYVDIKQGLLQLIALLYNVRGDCPAEGLVDQLPGLVKQLWNKYRIFFSM